jgi:hypothetical protein
MRAARLQTNDLGRADHFFGALLSKDNIKDSEKPQTSESFTSPQLNGGSIPLRSDAKNRFSDPPAPPPQQPLPEKPDVTRSSPSEPSPPSLKRISTERARSGTSVSPTGDESTSQIVSLVEALASAKREIDSQSARMRDLEEMLQKERQARELAEELAKQLEQQSSLVKVNGHDESRTEGLILKDSFVPPSDQTESIQTSRVRRTKSPSRNVESPKKSELQDTSIDQIVDPKAINTPTALLEQRMETMLIEMQQLKENMESFKKRAETAEAERDQDRKTLAEMVEKIRLEESARRSSSTERARSPAGGLTENQLSRNSGPLSETFGPLLQRAGLANGNSSIKKTAAGGIPAGTLSMPSVTQDPRLYHATPYASMLGVVLIGMGVMAYLNGWHPPKSDG